MQRFKKFVAVSVAVVTLLFGLNVSVDATICAVTACRDLTRNNQTGNATSSNSPNWRAVTVRGRNSATSAVNARFSSQSQTQLVLGT